MLFAPPLGGFLKPPAMRVVADLGNPWDPHILEYAVQRIVGGLGKNTHFPGVSENHPQLQLL